MLDYLMEEQGLIFDEKAIAHLFKEGSAELIQYSLRKGIVTVTPVFNIPSFLLFLPRPRAPSFLIPPSSSLSLSSSYLSRLHFSLLN